MLHQIAGLLGVGAFTSFFVFASVRCLLPHPARQPQALHSTTLAPQPLENPQETTNKWSLAARVQKSHRALLGNATVVNMLVDFAFASFAQAGRGCVIVKADNLFPINENADPEQDLTATGKMDFRPAIMSYVTFSRIANLPSDSPVRGYAKMIEDYDPTSAFVLLTKIGPSIGGSMVRIANAEVLNNRPGGTGGATALLALELSGDAVDCFVPCMVVSGLSVFLLLAREKLRSCQECTEGLHDGLMHV
eukprot:gnl/TRDRNA2_/TRDRNA2_43679_c0_seq1.p1 gnl/TRDRNA2_/TRDRNA2_43679_c0~~gnl/TRDRNA2_/TRDRNA2_43679_c0_seq1.p1  ORF type:complete len:249 (-),score=24.58 gnl/TRDRNA2_/TRDRNA2_43679_c0_seq1:68-814(-)